MEEMQAKHNTHVINISSEGTQQRIDIQESLQKIVQQEEIAKIGHTAQMTQLNYAKEAMHWKTGGIQSVFKERNMAIRRAESAISLSNDIEKAVKVLRLELVTARKSLASAHAVFEEVEKHRRAAVISRDRYARIYKEELKGALEEMKQLEEKILLVRGLKATLETASNLLLGVQDELTAYMITQLCEESGRIEKGNLKDVASEPKKTDLLIGTSSLPIMELEEVKTHVKQAKHELDCLNVAAMPLNAQLERERAALESMRQSKEMTSAVVSSLEAELERIISELKLVESKENDTRHQMVQLPKALQQAAREADHMKSAARLAKDELLKAQEEANQAKANADTKWKRLGAVLKEIESFGASKSLALAAIKALQESEQITDTVFISPDIVTLSLEEYYMLSSSARCAEESASKRVALILSQVENAKNSELKSLKKLVAMKRELNKRREAVREAIEKAEKAEQSKLAGEQELRMRRFEYKQQTEVSNTTQDEAVPCSHDKDTAKSKICAQENDRDSARAELIRKKASLFPHLVMLLTRKKAQP